MRQQRTVPLEENRRAQLGTRRTGLGTVVNTSFNMHEEPIVCTIEDALRAVRAAGLPFLAAGDFLVDTRGEGGAR